MQIVRFSVITKEMQSVLDGWITDFILDEWRARGRFFVGSPFVLMDDWKYRSPQYPVNFIFGKGVVTKLERGWRDFDKTRIWFEVVERYDNTNV